MASQLNNKYCLITSSVVVSIIAYIFYSFTKPNYNVGDAQIYYQQHSNAIEAAINENINQLFDDENSFVYIKTEDNFTIYIEQCIKIAWHTNNQIKKIKPILFVNGGPGIPPMQCPLFLSLLTNQLNNDDHYYIPYIYHQRGTGKSSRLYSKNQSFSNWNDKSNALKYLHNNLGTHQHILDIERIRQYLFQFYQTKLSKKISFKKISLIGHSFGAIFSSLYAAEFPQNTAELILIAGAPLLDFNVFMPKYNIFSMIREYLSQSMIAEFDECSSKFTNYFNLMESNETEIVNVYMEFIKYYNIANEKYLELTYSDYNKLVCLQHTQNVYDFDKNIGGWMTIAIYYDMGMWHFWNNKINKNICEYTRNNNIDINVLVLHCEYDLQTSDASFEFVQLFECNHDHQNNKHNINNINDTMSKVDHMIVYHQNKQCAQDLTDKIKPIFTKE
eukprot:282024_1